MLGLYATVFTNEKKKNPARLHERKRFSERVFPMGVQMKVKKTLVGMCFSERQPETKRVLRLRMIGGAGAR